MKKIYLLMAMVTSLLYSSQVGKVGINTSTPAATLDIQPNTANALTTATTAEGLLVPRVSRQRAANMGTTPAVSTLIYVNSVADGSAAGTTANVDAVGFYYFNGSVWTKLNAGGGGGSTVEPLNQMGTTSTQSTTNTTNSYLNAKLGIGDFSGTTGLAAMGTTEKFRIINGDQAYVAEGTNFSDAYYKHYSNTVGNRASILFDRARGTAASPTAVVAGDQLGSIYYQSQGTDHMYVDVIRGASAGVSTMQYKTGTGTNIMTINSDASRAVTTTGAVYAKTRAHNGDLLATTWAADDYSIILTGTTNNISLPDATTNTGRVISLTNQTGGNRTYVGTAANKPLNTGSITGGKGQLLISDGTVWQLVGGF